MLRISWLFWMDWIISRMPSLSCSRADAVSLRASTLITKKQNFFVFWISCSSYTVTHCALKGSSSKSAHGEARYFARTWLPADPKSPAVFRSGLPWTASCWTCCTSLRSSSPGFSPEPLSAEEFSIQRSVNPKCARRFKLSGSTVIPQATGSSAPGRTFPNMGFSFLLSLLTETSRGTQRGGGARPERRLQQGAVCFVWLDLIKQQITNL